MAYFLVTFLTLKMIQYVIAIGPIRNLDTGISHIMCTFIGDFSSLKFDSTCNRGWVPKFATGLIYQIGHSSKSIQVTMLVFCQTNSLMRGSLWPKDNLMTYIIFELCLIWYISPVANFGTHSLAIGPFRNLDTG